MPDTNGDFLFRRIRNKIRVQVSYDNITFSTYNLSTRVYEARYETIPTIRDKRVSYKTFRLNTRQEGFRIFLICWGV